MALYHQSEDYTCRYSTSHNKVDVDGPVAGPVDGPVGVSKVIKVFNLSNWYCH
jgi:hypothetical protein